MAKQSKNQPPLEALPPLPVRMLRLHAKLLTAAVIGVAAAVLMPWTWRLPTRLLSGWDIGVLVYLVMTHTSIFRASVERIRRRASEQDEGAFIILLLTIAAAIASLVAIVFELGGVKEASSAAVTNRVLLVTATILLSWAFVQTIFAIHYAHEYYGQRRDGKIGGLKFPGDDDPDYRDFLYFSLVIAMTSQVSDVAITSRAIRQVVSMHAVLAFFFNLTILALTVNMISNVI
jgi:uncharacterized membrane protein